MAGPGAFPIATICKLLDIDEREAQRLIKSGALPRGERGMHELVPAVQGYVRHLRERPFTDAAKAATLTQQEFATIVGISQAAVSQLVDAGVLVRNGDAATWIAAYASKLREEAAGRSAVQAHERARLERLKADHQEMVNAQKRRELVPASLLEKILANTGRRIAVILENIPERVRRELSESDPAIVAMLRDEITRARNEAATLAFPLDELDGPFRADATALERAGSADGAAAAPAVAMG